MKETWRIINRLLGKTKTKMSVKEIAIKGGLSSDDQKIANEFNDFFSSLPKNLYEKLPKSKRSFRRYLGEKEIISFFLEPTCIDEIWKIITHMRSKKSTCFDKISSQM